MSSAGFRRVTEFREIVGKVVGMLSERSITVTQQGARAYVTYDTRTNIPTAVNLPFIPDGASEEVLSATRGFLDHEVAHILFTDGGAQNDDRLLQDDGTVNQAAFRLYNILEDSRIERAMQHRFPGSAANLNMVFDFVSKTVIEPELKKAVKAGSQAKIFSMMFPALVYSWAGRTCGTQFLDRTNGWDLLAKEIVALTPFKERILDLKSTKEAVDLAVEIRIALTPPPVEEELAPPAPLPPVGTPPPPTSGPSGTTPPKEEEPAAEDSAERDEEEELPDATTEGEGEGEGDESAEAEEPPPSEDADAGEGEGEDDTGEGEAPDEPEASDASGDAESEGEAPPETKEKKEKSKPKSKAKPKPPAEEEASDEDGAGDSEDDTGDGSGDESDTGDIGDGDADGSGTPPPPSTARIPEDLSASMTEGLEDEDTPDVKKALEKLIAKEQKSEAYLPFTTDHDRWELVPTPEEMLPDIDSRISKLENDTRAGVGQMQTHMRRMFAQQAITMNVGGMRSGRLQSSALHRLSAGDDRVFYRREESEATDTAVSLLIDCSGSMGGEKIKIACHAGFALSQTLDRLHIANEANGFTTHSHYPKGYRELLEESAKLIGRDYSRPDLLQMYRFKTWEEQFNLTVKRRFVAGGGTGSRYSSQSTLELENNVDGESLLWAARKVLLRREPRKVIMVLSDGNPAGSGSTSALHKHLIGAVKEVEKMGIETIGIGITDTSVKHYYPKHIIINDLEELAPAVIGQLQRILVTRRPV